MKSQKIDIRSIVGEIIDEIGLSEPVIYEILAIAYGKAFKSTVKSTPILDGETVKYILVDESGKVLNGLKLTHPKIQKISDIFRTKCIEITNQRDLSRRLKTLNQSNSNYTHGRFEAKRDSSSLFYISDLGIYTKVPNDQFDILKSPLKEKDELLLKMTSIKVKHSIGKVETTFVFKDKTNITNLIRPFMVGIDFTVVDFYKGRVKVKIKKQMPTEAMKSIQTKSGFRIQFVWPAEKGKQ